MAKKTESTAVNDLINLVATRGPSVKDPGADLFSEPPKKSARMTGTVPPLKGAGAVEPLPRTRAPVGTQQNAAVNPPAVRVSTAMPRANSIPPLPEGAGRVRSVLPPPRSSASMPRPPIPSSAKIAVRSSASLAPPTLDANDVVVDVDEDIEADLLATPVAHQPRKVTPLEVEPVATIALPSADPIYPRAERSDHPNAAPDMTGAAPWFEDSRAVERFSIPEASLSMAENTAQVQRPKSGAVVLLKKLALPMGVAIALGVIVGGYIVFDGQGGTNRDAPSSAASTDNAAADLAPTDTVESAVAMPSVADNSATEPAEPDDPATAAPATAAPEGPSVLGGAVDSLPSATTRTTAKPVFVDVRIDSTPSGADVSLVDRGKTTFLGTTPINASVDPSRSYDVVFTFANKPTQVERLDPKATTRLAVTLGTSGNQNKEAAKPTKVEAPKAVKAEKGIATRKAEKKAVAEVKVTKTTPAKVAAPLEDETTALARKLAEKKAAKAESKTEEPAAEKAVAKAGTGVLMISSKPPCEIWVDGTSTGLMTPQRAMSLPAGKHKITLVSPDKAHKKTITVEITPDKPTKVIQDLLN